MPPAPATLSYTTNTFTSPEFLGALGTIIVLLAGAFGVQLPHLDPATQQMLGAFIGMVGTGFFHWLYPNASGKLSFSAPTAASVPAPQDVPVGASVVTVPHPADQAQVSTVQPIASGVAQTVEVAPAKSETPYTDARPASVTVTPA
jgi:hypothetical protein